MPQPNAVVVQDDITYVRYELQNVLPRYELIRDCVEQKVPEKGTKYLPQPNPTENTPANAARYSAYQERAVFYDVSARTLGGLVTQCYARDPEIKLPKLLQALKDDATGSGLSLTQLSKDSTRDAVGWGRGGIYVDYPDRTDPTTGEVRPATRKELSDGAVAPTFTIYPPENIINWDEEQRGSKLVKTLIVLKETVDVRGSFKFEQVTQYRELRIVNGIFTVQLWRTVTTPGAAAPGVVPSLGNVGQAVEMYEVRKFPTDANGMYFDEIPFEFIGAVNNDSTIDEAPLYGLCKLNIAHFRNSADYEEACFISGQPTPWFSGLTEDWVDKVFANGTVLLGSRQAVPLPENAQAGLLQIAPNILPIEAMRHKEAQMVALGARLVENRQVRRTLGEVEKSSAAETSILASCADNVSSAFTRALKWAAKFVGANPDECEFTLNRDFALTELSAEERMALIAEFQAGLISWPEVRARLKRGGIAVQDDQEAKTDIDTRQAKAAEDAIKLAQATKPVAPSGKPPPTK